MCGGSECAVAGAALTAGAEGVIEEPRNCVIESNKISIAINECHVTHNEVREG